MDNDFGSLGSLKKQARGKNLTRARVALVLAGILIAILGIFNYLSAERQIDDIIKKELVKGGVHHVPDTPEIREFKESSLRVLKLFCYGMVGIAVILLVFAILVYKFPLFCTVGGLILYIGFHLTVAFLLAQDEGASALAFLVSGFWWKIIIIGGLISGIRSAIAYSRELTEQRSSDVLAPQAEI